MNKLSHYKDNLFASHATMESAIEYVSMMANTFTTENSLAVVTAARVVLNTAIELHKAELAAANAPLLELIDARVAAAANEVRGELRSEMDGRIESAIEAQIQKAFTAVHTQVEFALETHDRAIDDRIESAIEDMDVEGMIENAIDNIDLETRVQDYMESNPVDVQDLLGGACVSITFG